MFALFKCKPRLYIPKKFLGIGGPATFMRNLLASLKMERVWITHDERDSFDGIFFPIAHDLSKLEKWKKKGVKIIQRLDGVYYPTKQGSDYAEKNHDLGLIHQFLADRVVYQSEYSRKQCELMLGKTGARRTELIVNGADLSIFFPRRQKNQDSCPFFVTTGNFRSADMIEPVVTALDEWWREGARFRFICVGPVIKDEIKPFFDREYLEHRGGRDLKEVADSIREADLFIYSHLNPPCPNSVIEAISCGVPIVGFDSGSMSELCYFSKELLAPVGGEILQEYCQFDPMRLLEVLRKWKESPEDWKRKAMEHSGEYGLRRMADQYAQVFESELAQ